MQKICRALLSVVTLVYCLPALSQEHIDPRIVDASSFSSEGPGPKTYHLQKNVRDKYPVAILNVSNDGVATLVDKDSTSGVAQSWTDFTSFTPLEAAHEWGPPTHRTRECETFELYNPAGEVFSVELSFAKAKLVRYRVHGPRVRDCWVSLQK
jgi:hypothetical protein